MCIKFTDKETLDLELELLASWYASEIAKLDLAYSWLRLSNGTNIREIDIVLVLHEYTERVIIRENLGITYEAAHELASQKYDYKVLNEKLKKEV